MTLAMQVAGQISQVVDASNFCVYLPPPDSANRNIADTEWNAQAFCMGNTPKALKANKMPDGFIQSAHFVVTDKYIQVTGQIDPAKANLNVTDEGGQMDVAARKSHICPSLASLVLTQSFSSQQRDLPARIGNYTSTWLNPPQRLTVCVAV